MISFNFIYKDIQKSPLFQKIMAELDYFQKQPRL